MAEFFLFFYLLIFFINHASAIKQSLPLGKVYLWIEQQVDHHKNRVDR